MCSKRRKNHVCGQKKTKKHKLCYIWCQNRCEKLRTQAVCRPSLNRTDEANLNFLPELNVPTHESKWDNNSLWDKGVGEEVLQWSIDCIQVRLGYIGNGPPLRAIPRERGPNPPQRAKNPHERGPYPILPRELTISSERGPYPIRAYTLWLPY